MVKPGRSGPASRSAMKAVHSARTAARIPGDATAYTHNSSVYPGKRAAAVAPLFQGQNRLQFGLPPCTGTPQLAPAPVC
jgi:hypothetical protein